MVLNVPLRFPKLTTSSQDFMGYLPSLEVLHLHDDQRLSGDYRFLGDLSDDETAEIEKSTEAQASKTIQYLWVWDRCPNLKLVIMDIVGKVGRINHTRFDFRMFFARYESVDPIGRKIIRAYPLKKSDVKLLVPECTIVDFDPWDACDVLRGRPAFSL
ncbi:hypothetical protein K402DRAFT_458854 [Aulographum hederae CBS 113979]|uniref:Uncharacterized protein n=1 Tax=Aulographum hederae CBS 113979 TaxID=1176131 RepID=A0A6G1HHP2_9PEZI|nr:hypothetical protein K402DRAFT_458854 [Aulographum hederae CBS 113979]